MPHPIPYLKHKLRQFKKLECKVRFGCLPTAEHPPLVWDEFFSTRETHDPGVRYPLSALAGMSREERKEVYGEYFYRVYFQKYRESGVTLSDVYDPKLLSLLGLSPSAGFQDIKRRFRELAKRYHPDHGGDSAQFIEMMEIYERLMSG